MIKLTDEEKLKSFCHYGNQTYSMMSSVVDDVAKVQLKKVVEWGNERCIEHDLEGYDRRECSQCWQSLLEEVK